MSALPDSDRIFVRGVTVHAFHGVMPHEAEVGQVFRIDLDLDVDLGEAAQSDRLVDTVGYDQVVAVACEAFVAQRHRLIEAAAGAVAQALLARFTRIAAVRVTIHKPHAPIPAAFDDVGVSILRRRAGSPS